MRPLIARGGWLATFLTLTVCTSPGLARAQSADCAFVAGQARIGDGSRSEADLLTGNEAHLGRGVRFSAPTQVAGERVTLGNGSQLFNLSAASVHKGRNVVVSGTETSTVPVLPECPVPAITCGGANVSVEKNGSTDVPAGPHGQLTLANGATARLAAGQHAFCGITGGRYATILVAGPAASTIGVAGDVQLGNASVFGPDSGAPLPTVQVSGGTFKVGAGSRIDVFLLQAPTARVTLGRSVETSGGLCATTLETGRRVTLDCPECGAFPPNTLPAGSYQLTCTNCSASGCVLGCQCRRIDGSANSTSLDLGGCAFGPDISNLNGVLTCTPR